MVDVKNLKCIKNAFCRGKNERKLQWPTEGRRRENDVYTKEARIKIVKETIKCRGKYYEELWNIKVSKN